MKTTKITKLGADRLGDGRGFRTGQVLLQSRGRHN